jgi:ribosomal protein S6
VGTLNKTTICGIVLPLSEGRLGWQQSNIQQNMSESNMPVTEAVHGADERELITYELAYHVLPTVAEGEVDAVTTDIKNLITKAGGQIVNEEAAERFELAYEISKYLEGRYRRFSSAYFGWIRFTLDAAQLAAVNEEVEAHKSILRTLTIRLTKAEEQNPFSFHESIAEIKAKNIFIADAEVEVAEVVAEEEIAVPVFAEGDEVAKEVVN